MTPDPHHTSNTTHHTSNITHQTSNIKQANIKGACASISYAFLSYVLYIKYPIYQFYMPILHINFTYQKNDFYISKEWFLYIKRMIHTQSRHIICLANHFCRNANSCSKGRNIFQDKRPCSNFGTFPNGDVA